MILFKQQKELKDQEKDNKFARFKIILNKKYYSQDKVIYFFKFRK